MVEIRSLEHTSLAEVVDCLLASFADYFVPISGDVAYWEKRFAAARVHWGLSFGVFYQDRLCGFIINGLDVRHGQRTAFNTGTGVIPLLRGNALVDQLYNYALPLLAREQVQACALEVITKNERAIRVYKRIGFEVVAHYHCFKGQLAAQAQAPVYVREATLAEVASWPLAHPSWDHTFEAMRQSLGAYKHFIVADYMEDIGFFSLNPATGYVAQLESASPDHWELLLAGLAQVAPQVKINNIDSRRAALLNALQHSGLECYIEQYEMARPV